MKNSEDYHVPVLSREVIEGLAIKPSGVYLDGTLGGGGHFGVIAKSLNSKGVIIGVDRDSQSIDRVLSTIGELKPNVIIEKSKFSQFDDILKKYDISFLDGILLDLGVSSHQIDEPTRGFSYLGESLLDMRMDQSNSITARELLINSSEDDLSRILADYGEVRNAPRMARTFKRYMKENTLNTFSDLRTCLESEYGVPIKIKVLAKVSQALRIGVNEELQELKIFLDKSIKLLRKGGRLAIISYHSLEDRIVKNFIKYQEKSCVCPDNILVCSCNKKVVLKRVNRKVIIPNNEEIKNNRRARSAKLRIAEKMVEEI